MIVSTRRAGLSLGPRHRPNRQRRVYLGMKWLGAPDRVALDAANGRRRCAICGRPIGHSAKHCRRCSYAARPDAPCREKAVQLYGLGFSSDEIARTCGLSRERVCQFLRAFDKIQIRSRVERTAARRKRLGLDAKAEAARLLAEEKREYRKAIKSEALRLYASGMSQREVGRELGLTQGTVSVWTSKAGISRPPGRKNHGTRSHHSRRRKYPWEEWQDGQEHTVLAADYGVTPRRLAENVTHRAWRCGLTATTLRQDGTVTFRFHQGEAHVQEDHSDRPGVGLPPRRASDTVRLPPPRFEVRHRPRPGTTLAEYLGGEA